MRKLLSANYARLGRSVWFWLGAAFMAGLGGIEIYSRQRLARDGFAGATLDDPILSFAPPLFLLLPIVGGLFINTDYHDGTIRNKITVGRARTAVCFANLLIVWLAGIFYTVIHLAVVLIGGIGLSFDNIPSVFVRSGLLLLSIMAIAAIAAFIATIITGRYALLLCAFTAIGMMFGSQMINGMLETTDTIPDYKDVVMISDDDGHVRYEYYDHDGNRYEDPDDIPMVPNPGYVREPLRSVLRGYNNVSPGGQLWEIIGRGHREWDVEKREYRSIETPYWQMALCSLCVTAGFTLLGLALFQRKDLK